MNKPIIISLSLALLMGGLAGCRKSSESSPFINLPIANHAPSFSDPDAERIYVNSDGNIIYQGQTVTRKELLNSFRAVFDKELTKFDLLPDDHYRFLIEADKTLPFSSVWTIADILTMSGIGRHQFAAYNNTLNSESVMSMHSAGYNLMKTKNDVPYALIELDESQVTLNGKKVSSEQLREVLLTLAAVNSNSIVYVEIPTNDIPYEQFINTLDTVYSAGLDDIQTCRDVTVMEFTKQASDK